MKVEKENDITKRLQKLSIQHCDAIITAVIIASQCCIESF